MLLLKSFTEEKPECITSLLLRLLVRHWPDAEIDAVCKSVNGQEPKYVFSSFLFFKFFVYGLQTKHVEIAVSFAEVNIHQRAGAHRVCPDFSTGLKTFMVSTNSDLK